MIEGHDCVGINDYFYFVSNFSFSNFDQWVSIYHLLGFVRREGLSFYLPDLRAGRKSLRRPLAVWKEVIAFLFYHGVSSDDQDTHT